MKHKPLSIFLIVLSVALLLMIGCQAPAQPAPATQPLATDATEVPAEPTDVVALIERYHRVFNNGDADATVGLISDDFVMKIVYGTDEDPVFEGKEALAELIASAVHEDHFQITVSNLQATSNSVTFDFSGIGDGLRELDVGPEVGTAEAMVQDGLIQSLTYTTDPEWVATADAAEAALAEPAVTTVPTSTPTVEPTSEPTPSPVELVWSVTGDPYPLNDPSGLALDAQGNLYVADTLNHRIQKFDSNGQFLTTWGSEGSDDGQFNFIWGDPGHNLALGGVAVDGQGNVYVADGGNARVQKFDSDGNFLAKWGSQGIGDGQFSRPMDLTMDQQGNIYVIDDRSSPKGRIKKFDSNGNFLARFGEGLFGDPGGMTIDGQGNLYVTDVVYGTILKLDNNGELLATWGGNGTANGQFIVPGGIDLDSEGNIYVVDSGRIQKLDSNGNFLFKWGRFREPYGIRIDSEGNIYLSDYHNDRIQKFRLR